MHTTGFASPAQGYEAESIDYNRLLIKHPAACFPMKYTGRNLKEYNISNGDILIVDSAALPSAGRLAVVMEDREFIVVILEKYGRQGQALFGYTDGHGCRQPVRNLFGIVTGIVRTL